MNARLRILLTMGLLAGPIAVHSEVLTGTTSEWYESSPAIEIGDDTNTVKFWWSASFLNLGYFYGSNYDAYPSDVAVAVGVTDISQITDASALSFTADFTTEQGPGTFLVARNNISGHYGVFRIDGFTSTIFTSDTLSGTWWFQTDGTGNFAPSDPGALLGQLNQAATAAGGGKRLADKVKLAQVYYEANDIPATCAVLSDFVSQLRNKGTRKKITAATADQLIVDTQTIMTAIGCN